MEILKRLGNSAIGKVCNETRPSDWTNDVTVALKELEQEDSILATAFSKCAGSGFSNWNPVCHTFWERGVPFPQIDVVIDDEAQSVELSRTVWHIVEQVLLHRYDDLLAAGTPENLVSEIMKRDLADFQIHRRFHGRKYPVEFETYSMESLMLPLLPGDEVNR